MPKERLIAFSDGVIAIIITMVLQVKAPHSIYVLVALTWLVPDRRIEHALRQGA